MTTCTTYEKALNILIKICGCIPNIRGDCLKCKTGMNTPTINCKEYYNPEPPRIDYKRRSI